MVLLTLIGSNYPCLELIFMVPKVFEPLKFDCMAQFQSPEAELKLDWQGWSRIPTTVYSWYLEVNSLLKQLSHSKLSSARKYAVDSRYLEIEGTL